MAGSGSTTINFGAFPGAPAAQVDVTGQTGFVASSPLEAWLLPIATADHSIDEHMIEEMTVRAHWIADGSFRIVAIADPRQQQTRLSEAPNLNQAQKNTLFGQFSIGWAWV
jgi:hypothetical protein